MSRAPLDAIQCIVVCEFETARIELEVLPTGLEHFDAGVLAFEKLIETISKRGKRAPDNHLVTRGINPGHQGLQSVGQRWLLASTVRNANDELVLALVRVVHGCMPSLAV
ncbi:hypothetical protein CAOG_009279 [Capsaspora owczarzaki ATCC 30864]|uniref:Uncharacterized protein n=1 Tax=Capsaspora owczarzaki (strain ATCC 30864) TaxID=595528 RepID=A0A0D2TZV8_CAPO3|nr:hypothetical protein CAOG_009279 [Capsaspora owczarzaki ATCC 30864]